MASVEKFKLKGNSFLLLLTLLLFDCKDPVVVVDPISILKDAQLVKLSKTWKITTATLNNTPQTYTGFQLVITSTTGQTTFGYNTTGRPALSPWLSSGTFTYGGTDFMTILVREDGLPITYSVSDTQLQMTFNYIGSGIPGVVQWVFTFGL